jgi:hypothetical protein
LVARLAATAGNHMRPGKGGVELPLSVTILVGRRGARSRNLPTL